jgi:hypothetical protein
MRTCAMPDGALANLGVSFAASDRAAGPWTALYNVPGTKGGARPAPLDRLVEDLLLERLVDLARPPERQLHHAVAFCTGCLHGWLRVAYLTDKIGLLSPECAQGRQRFVYPGKRTGDCGKECVSSLPASKEGWMNNMSAFTERLYRPPLCFCTWPRWSAASS